MADLKTQENDASVEAFLDSVAHEKRREDSFAMLALMKEVTGEEPRMWGSSIVGFGHYQYKYKSGREGEWFLTGFAPPSSGLFAPKLLSATPTWSLSSTRVERAWACEVSSAS